MLWWTQIIIALVLAACFGLLLACYRRQDTQQNAYLLGLLVGGASLMVPDMVVFLPLIWWAFAMLRAINVRTMIASLLGPLTIAFYGALVWLLWPDSNIVFDVENSWWLAVQRCFCWPQQPLWVIISAGAAALLGLVCQVAHLRHYAMANVRIQTRVLLSLPCYWVSLLSCLFPAVDGNCLWSLLILSSLYLTVLYLSTYGLPHIANPFAHPFNPSLRSFGKRSRGSNPFMGTHAGKPANRSFSRHSRWR